MTAAVRNPDASLAMAALCPGLICTASCLSARIMEHIRSDFFIPRFLEPCIKQETWAEGEYWLWMNRAILDNIVVDLAAGIRQHETEGKVNRSSQLWSANTY
jgi:hypothetical protein